jgi:Holliday junction resolvasome RuvABC endonuclease subunit
MTTLLGLDLSLQAAAAVAVPLDWDGDWSRVHSIVVGEPLHRTATDAERARRTETIAARLVAFAQAERATVAFIEGYAFGQRTSAHSIGELGGVVRLELVRAGIEIRTANMGTARKLLLGSCPKGAKVAAYSTLRAAGATFETLDESDAMVCANWGLSELGGYCFCQ